MSIRSFPGIVLVCLALSAPLFADAALASASEPPNIVFILADDMGYSDPGCYGGEIATPNLDALATSGLRFTNFYNNGRCWPSRASLLTGYHAQQIRRDKLPGLDINFRSRRPAWAPLLPHLLKPAGYRSYLSGKLHVDGSAPEGGFARAFSLDKNISYFSGESILLDGVETDIADGEDFYITTAVADHAIDCLNEHAEHYADRPFFQYLAFTAPHFPLHALPEDIEKYRDRYLDGWDELQKERYQRQLEMGLYDGTLGAIERDLGPPYHFAEAYEILGPGELRYPLPWDELTEEQRRFQATKMAIHAAMVDRMDQEIGRILNQLKAMDAFENTIIFFASDNGASSEVMVRGEGHDPEAPMGSRETYLSLGPGFSSASNTPFRRHKTWVHEGGIATPLIVHWPGGIAARNEIRETPGHFIDIVPTVLELAGIEKPGEWKGLAIPPAPGRSVVPAFSGEIGKPHPSLWWLHDGHRALRHHHWKIVASKGEAWELYNMATDRGEQHDLASERPELVDALSGRWQAHTENFIELVRKSEKSIDQK